jgi:hypothetical protein
MHRNPEHVSTKQQRIAALAEQSQRFVQHRVRDGVLRRLIGKWLKAGVQSINHWCRRHRHLPVAEQQAALNQKLRGHYAYFGITGNSPRLCGYARHVTRLWRKWLSRRRSGYQMPWPSFLQLLERYPLAPPRVVHSVYARAANPVT